MPPKKATSSEAGDGKFIWEGANETKLLMIMLGRHIGTSEFDEVAKAFPGATPGAIRNRIGVLRAKQKNLYESLGWDLPSAATPAKKGRATGTPAKRAAAAGGEEGKGEGKTPTKKPRKAAEKKDSGAEDEGVGEGGKEEEEEV